MPARRPDAARRLTAVCAAAGLMPVGAPTPVTSYSNDTWLLDDGRRGAVVLRVGWRGDITRLDREAAVGRSVPAELGYPEVLGHGSAVDCDQPLRWTLTRRLAGQPVDLAWPGLSQAARRSAVAQLATCCGRCTTGGRRPSWRGSSATARRWTSARPPRSSGPT